MNKLGRLMTAMVTPFTEGGEVDYVQARKLAKALLDSGSDGLVVCVEHRQAVGGQALAHFREAGEHLQPGALENSDEDSPDVLHPVADAGVLDHAGDTRPASLLVHLAHRLEGTPDTAAVVHLLAGREPVARVEHVSLANVVSVKAGGLGEHVHDALDRERRLQQRLLANAGRGFRPPNIFDLGTLAGVRPESSPWDLELALGAGVVLRLRRL